MRKCYTIKKVKAFGDLKGAEFYGEHEFDVLGSITKGSEQESNILDMTSDVGTPELSGKLLLDTILFTYSPDIIFYGDSNQVGDPSASLSLYSDTGQLIVEYKFYSTTKDHVLPLINEANTKFAKNQRMDLTLYETVDFIDTVVVSLGISNDNSINKMVITDKDGEVTEVVRESIPGIPAEYDVTRFYICCTPSSPRITQNTYNFTGETAKSDAEAEVEKWKAYMNDNPDNPYPMVAISKVKRFHDSTDYGDESLIKKIYGDTISLYLPKNTVGVDGVRSALSKAISDHILDPLKGPDVVGVSKHTYKVESLPLYDNEVEITFYKPEMMTFDNDE